MRLLVCFIALYLGACTQQNEKEVIAKSDAAIPPEIAAKFVGETKSVCGVVRNVKYERWKKRQPTIIIIGTPGSDLICKVVVLGKHRENFEKPLEELLDRTKIRVSGKIELEDGIPRIILDDPSKLEIVWSATKTDTLPDGPYE